MEIDFRLPGGRSLFYFVGVPAIHEKETYQSKYTVVRLEERGGVSFDRISI